MERRSSDPVLIQMSQQIGELLATARSANENLIVIRDDLHDLKENHGARIASLETSRSNIKTAALGISAFVSFLGTLAGKLWA